MQNQTSYAVNMVAMSLVGLSQKNLALPINLKSYKRRQLAQNKASQKHTSRLSIGVVLLAHALAIYLLASQSPAEKLEVLITKPMMVSLIAPPALKPAPATEIVPILAPQKLVVPQKLVTPKPVVKKMLEKISPINAPAERLVEAAAVASPVADAAVPASEAASAQVAQPEK